MRILVAGGAGYVGSALVPRLVERGYDVEVADLLWFGCHLPPDVPVRQQDVLELGEGDLRGFDQVVFLAGLSNDPMAEFAPARNFVANAACPAYLAYIAKRAGVRRFVYASSCSIYGYTENELYDEARPAVSAYPYGISKRQGEFAVIQLGDADFSAISLRKGTICGYSPRMRLDLVVNTMFSHALIEGSIRVNNPAIWRPILAVQDAVTAYVRAIEASQEVRGIFNVASGNFTVGEIADAVADGLKERLGLQARLDILHESDYRNYKVDVQKARNVLSFKPRFGIRDIVDDLVDHRALFADMENPLYNNIRTFRSEVEGSPNA